MGDNEPSGEPGEPGWYRIMSSPGRPVRYWDGERWHADEDAQDDDDGLPPPSREVFRHERRTVVERLIDETGARPGEGIPFHELYLRRKNSKKYDW